MIKKMIWASCLILGLPACKSDKLPKDIMTPNELKTVMWDLFAVGELKLSDTSSSVKLHMKDSTTAAFSEVLHIHNLSKNTFMHSFKYYESHPDKQNILIDTLIAYNDRQVKIYEKKYHKTNQKQKGRDTLKAKPIIKPSLPLDTAHRLNKHLKDSMLPL